MDEKINDVDVTLEDIINIDIKIPVDIKAKFPDIDDATFEVIIKIGYANGYLNGYNNGSDNGYDESSDKGYDEGYYEGYDKGFNAE